LTLAPAYIANLKGLVDLDAIKGAGLKVLVDAMWAMAGLVSAAVGRREDCGGGNPSRAQPDFSGNARPSRSHQTWTSTA
jgi:phosphoglucomutase